MNISFAENISKQDVSLVALMSQSDVLPKTLQEMDQASLGYITQSMAGAGFNGSANAMLSLFVPEGGNVRSVTLVGLGPADKLCNQSLNITGGKIAKHLASQNIHRAEVIVNLVPKSALETKEMAIELAMGAGLSAYEFQRHKTDKQDVQPKDLCFCLQDADAVQDAFVSIASIVKAVGMARDLTNEPPNMLVPSEFAARCKALEKSGLEVKILDQAALSSLGMGALLGVAQGSVEPPAVAILTWKGAEGSPVVMVGKGVTFDSGGLLPKGPEEMWDMKNDMAGAAAVVATISSAAERQIPVHVIGIIGLVENMPSGHALRPGDVVRSYSGKTIEVLHTDAEGRLVLADLLSYAKEQFTPRALIDIATLTGAMTAVLGQEYAGLFTNDDGLSSELNIAGDMSGEKVWRLPLSEVFDRMIDSSVADVQNITKQRMAGSATAAQFLNRFVGNIPWAHLDICGTAWRKDKDMFGVTGATGYGVRLLCAYLDQQSLLK